MKMEDRAVGIDDKLRVGYRFSVTHGFLIFSKDTKICPKLLALGLKTHQMAANSFRKIRAMHTGATKRTTNRYM